LSGSLDRSRCGSVKAQRSPASGATLPFNDPGDCRSLTWSKHICGMRDRSTSYFGNPVPFRAIRKFLREAASPAKRLSSQTRVLARAVTRSRNCRALSHISSHDVKIELHCAPNTEADGSWAVWTDYPIPLVVYWRTKVVRALFLTASIILLML
jgi:hypothetical protein